MLKYYLLPLFLFPICLYSQIIPIDSINQNDGPYIYTDLNDNIKIIEVTPGIIDIVEKQKIPKRTTIKTSGNKYEFSVETHPIQRSDWKYPMPDSLVVLSDLHGNFEAFISVLKSQHIIDENLNWSYGNGHLMVIGDVFDRGDDVLPLFWLLYKLDEEATRYNGKLHFLYGNHEDMILRNNLKYANHKYKKLAEALGIDYNKLWQETSVLGEWLLSKNAIEIIGDNLFVHAGLSPKLAALQLSIPQINKIISSNILTSKEDRKKDELVNFMFSNDGPLWYRGMVLSDEKYNLLSGSEVDQILRQYEVNRIIVGHTIFSDVSSFFDGKVVGVNVNNAKNMKHEKSRGLLIKYKTDYVIFDKPNKLVPLNEMNTIYCEE